MQNLLNELKVLLQQDDRLVVDGKLLKNKIIELALQLDPSLLKILLSQPIRLPLQEQSLAAPQLLLYQPG